MRTAARIRSLSVGALLVLGTGCGDSGDGASKSVPGGRDGAAGNSGAAGTIVGHGGADAGLGGHSGGAAGGIGHMQAVGASNSGGEGGVGVIPGDEPRGGGGAAGLVDGLGGDAPSLGGNPASTGPSDGGQPRGDTSSAGGGSTGVIPGNEPGGRDGGAGPIGGQGGAVSSLGGGSAGTGASLGGLPEGGASNTGGGGVAGRSSEGIVAGTSGQTGMEPIQGRPVCTPQPSASDIATAQASAWQAVRGAFMPGHFRSWQGDPADKVRSYTWDLAIVAGAAQARGDSISAAQALRLLVTRQLPSGAWPVMLSNAPQESNLDPGSTETAAALAILGAVSDPSLRAEIAPAITLGLVWLKAIWHSSGMVLIDDGATQASTEPTAVAVMAALALRDRCDWCEAQARSAVTALTTLLWSGNHFARGFNLASSEADNDETGPHTHQSLGYLALDQAARDLGLAELNVQAFYPIDWLRAHFTRTAESAGRVVTGIGDRLTLVSNAGLLYGCDGGRLSPTNEGSLDCPVGALVVADPAAGCSQCFSPYERACAKLVDSIPPDTRPVANVNSEVTALAAIAALAADRPDDARALLNGVLALMRPDGGVLAIAGPVEAAPGVPLGYPQNHRLREFAYTALADSGLHRRNPFAPNRELSLTLPDRLEFPSDLIPAEVPLSLSPDPCVGKVVHLDDDTVRLEQQTRPSPKDWVAWNTSETADLEWPDACFRLEYGLRGEGPWTSYDVKALEPREPTDPSAKALHTHGIAYPGGVTSDVRAHSVHLAHLSLFWDRDQDDDDDEIFRPWRLSFVQKTNAQSGGAQPAGTPIVLELTRPRLVRGDGLQGAPVKFYADRIVTEPPESPPITRNVNTSDGTAVEVTYDVANGKWQRVVVADRWNWSCATEVRLRYQTSSAVTVQVVLEDSRADADYATGARYFSEAKLPASDQSGEWVVPRENLRNFDENDTRPLNWSSLRTAAVAFPSASTGKILLFTLDALARPNDLANGICHTM